MSLKWWSGSKTRRLAWALEGEKKRWILNSINRGPGAPFFRYAVDPGNSPSSSRGTQSDRRELVFWLDGDTSDHYTDGDWARPVGSEVIEIVPEPRN